jgi:hypothetical protein
MTAPTRRQMLAGSLAAAGAAAAPAIAVAADPEERLRNAVAELTDAAKARWPDADFGIYDCLHYDTEKPIPVLMIAVHRP